VKRFGARITGEQWPTIVAVLIAIGMDLLNPFLENPLSNQRLGAFSILCMSFGASYYAVRGLGGRLGRTSAKTIGALVATFACGLSLALLSFWMGGCGHMSFADFVFMRKLDWVACSAPLSISYGFLASAITLVLANAIGAVYSVIVHTK